MGPAGPTGPIGPQGATGPQGLTGARGPTGADGVPGADGITFLSGSYGPLTTAETVDLNPIGQGSPGPRWSRMALSPSSPVQAIMLRARVYNTTTGGLHTNTSALTVTFSRFTNAAGSGVAVATCTVAAGGTGCNVTPANGSIPAGSNLLLTVQHGAETNAILGWEIEIQ